MKAQQPAVSGSPRLRHRLGGDGTYKLVISQRAPVLFARVLGLLLRSSLVVPSFSGVSVGSGVFCPLFLYDFPFTPPILHAI
jgi:hypothetical protein